jgi:hypothetical protein
VFDSKPCRYGYSAPRGAITSPSRRIFERIAKEGVLAAMPWMAWTEENGYDRPSDPARAAEWDRKAADAGYRLTSCADTACGAMKSSVAPFVDRAAGRRDARAADLAAHGYDSGGLDAGGGPGELSSATVLK